LQQWVDGDIRRRFGLSAQMACNAPRKVGAAYHTLWAKVKQNTEHRKKGFTKKCYKGLDQPPVFTAGTTTISYNRDYRWKSGQRVSITTVDGPRVFAYERYAKHVAMIGAGNRSGVTFGAAKLWRDPRT
jgi:lipoate-protein ligase B